MTAGHVVGQQLPRQPEQPLLLGEDLPVQFRPAHRHRACPDHEAGQVGGEGITGQYPSGKVSQPHCLRRHGAPVQSAAAPQRQSPACTIHLRVRHEPFADLHRQVGGHPCRACRLVVEHREGGEDVRRATRQPCLHRQRRDPQQRTRSHAGHGLALRSARAVAIIACRPADNRPRFQWKMVTKAAPSRGPIKAGPPQK